MDQSWFWTPEWQAGEREADADIAAGRVRTFETVDELLAWLAAPDEDHPDGEGPVTREEARERVKGWIDKPEHKPKKDKEKHEDALDDPALTVEEEPDGG